MFEASLFRLVALKCVVVHRHFPVDLLPNLNDLFLYWPKKMEAHCHGSLVRMIVIHCKQIQKLCLYGWIRDKKANWIAYKLPQLEHLDIQSCVLSSRALAIILDGQKELKYLDTRHAACFDDEFVHRYRCNPFGEAIDWNEEEIHPKVAGIKTYLECLIKCCPNCNIYYDSSVSRLGLCAWLLYRKTSQPHENGSCLSKSCLVRRMQLLRLFQQKRTSANEEYEGLRLSYRYHCVALEEISRASGSVGEDWEPWSEREIPTKGFDVVSMKCRTDRVDGGYILNGNNMWCTNGPIAQTLDCAAAILCAAERATQVVLQAIQCLGGNGYMNEYPTICFDTPNYMRLEAGTSEIRMIIGRELFKEQ